MYVLILLLSLVIISKLNVTVMFHNKLSNSHPGSVRTGSYSSVYHSFNLLGCRWQRGFQTTWDGDTAATLMKLFPCSNCNYRHQVNYRRVSQTQVAGFVGELCKNRIKLTETEELVRQQTMTTFYVRHDRKRCMTQ